MPHQLSCSSRFSLPLTRSSMTCDSTDTTVLLPIRASAIEAAERMKSPARIACREQVTE